MLGAVLDCIEGIAQVAGNDKDVILELLASRASLVANRLHHKGHMRAHTKLYNIYIYREREREREIFICKCRSAAAPSRTHHPPIPKKGAVFFGQGPTLSLMPSAHFRTAPPWSMWTWIKDGSTCQRAAAGCHMKL